ncbi:MAG: hypothetical protein Q8P36_00500 [bacterium]|nr:hypothetical protein [bacterium]
MMHIRQTLKSHWAALILALLASIIVAAPQTYFRMEHRDLYQGQGMELIPDSPWSSRVREVMDGHPSLGSIYYKDGKSDPYLFQPMGSMVVAYLGMPFGLGINDTLLLSRLVLTFMTVLLLYAFVYLLSRSTLAALSASATILFAEQILNASGMLRFLQGINPSTFLGISMPVNHAMIFIPFFGFLITFWLFYKKRLWWWGVMSAILLGLNFYNYFYSWTYLYAFGGLLVLALLVSRQWREAVRVGSVFIGALLVAVPYGLNLYQASQYPSYAEVSTRFGVVASHAPLFVGFVALIAILVFLRWFPREDRERYLFGLALLLAPLITMNQQLLTGKVMQVGHYHWYFHKPIAIIIMIVTLFYLLSRWRLDAYKKVLAACIITVSITAGVFTQAASYLHDATYGERAGVERQRYGPVMQWLSANARPEEVALANSDTSYLIAIYTPLNLFYHRAGYATLAATRDRLLDQLFTFYRLRGIGAEDAHHIFFQERKEISWNIYGIYYREVLGSYEAIPDELIEDILERYEATLATPTSQWLKQQMTQYEVNYVIWDKKTGPSWQLSKYPFLKEAAMFGDIAIYRFAP